MDFSPGIAAGGRGFYGVQPKNNTSNTFANANDRLWIRGGDSPSGSTTTAGFPLSWNDSDYAGIHLMTQNSGADTTNNHWYWVSWAINVPAYFWFICGDAGADSDTMGPHEVTWSRNAVADSAYIGSYPAYPGEYREINSKLGGISNPGGNQHFNGDDPPPNEYLRTQSFAFRDTTTQVR
jgi:hypothetical protein